MTAIPTELLDLAKKYSTPIYRGTVVIAVVSVLALCFALTSAYDGPLGDSMFFIVGFIFLLLYIVQHWMFVRPIQAQYASGTVTPLDILFPVVVFAVQGIISVIYINTALKYLNASPDYFMSRQSSEWRECVPLFFSFTIIAGLVTFSCPRMLVLRQLAMFAS